MVALIKSIIEKRWAIIALAMGILVGFLSAYLCIHLNFIIFGFNIMYIISPLAAGFVETVIARKMYGKSIRAISAILTFILINIYGWIILGIITDNPTTLSLITLIAIILTIQAAFPIFMNYILFVVTIDILKKFIAFLAFLHSKIRKTNSKETKRISKYPDDELFLDKLDIPLLTMPPFEVGRIKKNIGLVIGEAIVQETETKDFIGKLLKINKPTNLDDFKLGKARKVAIFRMLENAVTLGANTVIDVSLDYSSMGGFQGNALIVTATGTAVIYQ